MILTAQFLLESLFIFILKQVNSLKIGNKYFFHEEMAREILSAPLRIKIVLSSNTSLLYSEEPALQHSFNTAIGKLIRVHGAEILFETCQILTAKIRGANSVGT